MFAKENCGCAQNSKFQNKDKGLWGKTKDMSDEIWDKTKELSEDAWNNTKKAAGELKNKVTEKKQHDDGYVIEDAEYEIDYSEQERCRHLDNKACSSHH